MLQTPEGQKNNRKQLFRFLSYFGVAAIAIFVILLAINVQIHRSAERKISSFKVAPSADAIILLGASVYESGKLTPVLEDRARTVVALFAAGKAPKILVSGDGRASSYNEVTAMQKFLLAEGVSESAMILDPAGINTFESIRRAKEALGQSRVLIVSQRPHLNRALFLADRAGLEAVGVPALGWKYDLKNLVREFLATGRVGAQNVAQFLF